MAVKGTGLKTGQLVPHLLVRGVARAIKFYAVGSGSTPIMQPEDLLLGRPVQYVEGPFWTRLGHRHRQGGAYPKGSR